MHHIGRLEILADLLPELKWGVWNARFAASGPEACRSISGACWSVITAQWKLVLLGTYPVEEIWRPLGS
ncbi:hypothetical protein CHELA40_12642 [Chelatococcus asaccharovorans]|nr:hypothetical protein CHELA40_12642 [Chelatococcus asaccharovorans]